MIIRSDLLVPLRNATRLIDSNPKESEAEDFALGRGIHPQKDMFNLGPNFNSLSGLM